MPKPTQRHQGGGVNIIGPAADSIVGRSLQMIINIDDTFGFGADVQLSGTFSVGGRGVDGFSPWWDGTRWVWQGLVSTAVHAGQAFAITVTAHAEIPGFPVFLIVDGSATVNCVLENVVPVLSVHPFQSRIVVAHVPCVFSISGSVTEGHGVYPYSVPPAVQYKIANGPFIDVPVFEGRWIASLTLGAGDQVITIQASDAYRSLATFQKKVTVDLMQPSASPDSDVKPNRMSAVPGSSWISNWTRLGRTTG